MSSVVIARPHSAVAGDFLNQFQQHLLAFFIGHLAGARIAMATATIGQAQGANISLATAIHDGTTYGKNRIDLVATPYDVNRNIALVEQGINHESIAGVDGFLIAQVQYHQVAMYDGAVLDLLFEQGVLLGVQVGSFLDVGQFQDFVDRVIT